MEQRISIVTLGVKNLAVSRRFYVDGLSWKPVYEDKEIIFFQTGGMVFALFLRDKLAEDFQAKPALPLLPPTSPVASACIRPDSKGHVQNLLPRRATGSRSGHRG